MSGISFLTLYSYVHDCGYVIIVKQGQIDFIKLKLTRHLSQFETSKMKVNAGFPINTL